MSAWSSNVSPNALALGCGLLGQLNFADSKVLGRRYTRHAIRARTHIIAGEGIMLSTQLHFFVLCAALGMGLPTYCCLTYHGERGAICSKGQKFGMANFFSCRHAHIIFGWSRHSLGIALGPALCAIVFHCS